MAYSLVLDSMFSPFLRSNALRMAARGVAASFSAGYCAFGDEQGAPGVAGEAYPTYSRADIKARCGGASTWVTYKDGVYDITEFINAHPGGAQKIKLAAGGSVEPFWRIYRQHLEQQAGVMDLLAPMRVGTLSAEDYASETCAAKTVDADDPYGDEPERHPALIVHGATPMNAESPPALLGDTYLTPNDLWYVRNHHPVPRLNGDAHEVALALASSPERGTSLAVGDLKSKFPRTEVTATMQCSGNRRGHMNQYGTTSGTAWGCGAASTATWAGVPLRDLVGELLDLGAAPLAAAKKLGLRHAIFEAADDMQASIPLEKALGELGDVLVAYEMNGAPIPRDHGGPLRVVVPGYAGVRNVKWVKRIVLSADTAVGAWERGMNYKAMPSHWKSKADLKGVDFATLPSIHELPTQCAFSAPAAGDAVDSDDESFEAKGWALGSAGRAVHRVEVSADGGATWTEASLDRGTDQPYGRAWAWTTWSCDLPIPAGPEPLTLLARAADLGGGAMPRTPEDVWNIRGLNNNSWHTVTLGRTVSAEDDDE